MQPHFCLFPVVHAHAQTHTPLPYSPGTFLSSLLLGRRPRSQFHYSGCRQCKWVRLYRGPPLWRAPRCLDFLQHNRGMQFGLQPAGGVAAQPCFLSGVMRSLELLRHSLFHRADKYKWLKRRAEFFPHQDQLQRFKQEAGHKHFHLHPSKKQAKMEGSDTET